MIQKYYLSGFILLFPSKRAPTNGPDCRNCYCNKIPIPLLRFGSQISGSKSLEALSEVDELAPPVPKKGSKPDLTSGISPESIRRRPTKLHHRSSSPAGMLRTVTSPVQPPHDKYDSLDLLSIRHFRVEPLQVEFLNPFSAKRSPKNAVFNRLISFWATMTLNWPWCC